ncbi:hypothetical protein ACOZ4I_20270 (plasmid) [Haloarcula salina]|uniref:hypothetical protein n=1 Tax=Haloarcula salina TaxID=1429914 RepID=UPI003C6EBC0B
MISRRLDHGIEDARLLVKGALELIDDIKTYHESQYNEIIAKTGFRWGIISSSYGEKLTVSLTSIDEETTEVTVVGEKEVEINIGANPDQYVLEFIDRLETLADYPLDDVIELLSEETANSTKEMTSPSDQADGSQMIAIAFVAIFLMFMFVLII